MDKETLKRQAAEAAIKYVQPDTIVGVGTGSTVNYFIDALSAIKQDIDACVSSSRATTQRLKKYGIPVIDLNAAGPIPLYVDGADEVSPTLALIKGGGGAMTEEKILACVAEKFICIADQSKRVDFLGRFPVAVEVIPSARSYVARKIVRLDGDPVYREGFKTDNGNIILDVHGLDLADPGKVEHAINQITGVVCHGIFSDRRADIALIANGDGVETLTRV